MDLTGKLFHASEQKNNSKKNLDLAETKEENAKFLKATN